MLCRVRLTPPSLFCLQVVSIAQSMRQGSTLGAGGHVGLFLYSFVGLLVVIWFVALLFVVFVAGWAGVLGGRVHLVWRRLTDNEHDVHAQLENTHTSTTQQKHTHLNSWKHTHLNSAQHSCRLRHTVHTPCALINTLTLSPPLPAMLAYKYNKTTQTGPMDAGAMCMPGAVNKIQALIDDAVSKGAQVLVGGRIGPANYNPGANGGDGGASQAAAAAATHGSAAGAGAGAAPLTPTRLTRRAAAAMAAAATGAADGSSGSSSAGGQFYPPTVIVGVTPEMSLYHEEVFGPVSCCWWCG